MLQPLVVMLHMLQSLEPEFCSFGKILKPAIPQCFSLFFFLSFTDRTITCAIDWLDSFCLTALVRLVSILLLVSGLPC